MTWLYVLIGLLWLFGWWYTATAWARINGYHSNELWWLAVAAWLFLLTALIVRKTRFSDMPVAKSKMFDFWGDK